MDYKNLVDSIIEAHLKDPIDILGTGGASGEYNYMKLLADSYVRTVREVDALYQHNRAGTSVLEIGSFLGPVSIALKKLGYRVSALDIPEFHQSAPLRALYERHGIPFAGVNLRNRVLPYDPASQDVIVACEVLEHLNFNPLPVLQEMNRVLRKGGHLYVAMPNQIGIKQRLKFVLGKSVHNPISDFFLQLGRGGNMIVGLHWREYTLAETVDMFRRMGFEIVRAGFFAPAVSSLYSLVIKMFGIYPPFRPFQVVIGKKCASPVHDFWITEANS